MLSADGCASGTSPSPSRPWNCKTGGPRSHGCGRQCMPRHDIDGHRNWLPGCSQGVQRANAGCQDDAQTLRPSAQRAGAAARRLRRRTGCPPCVPVALNACVGLEDACHMCQIGTASRRAYLWASVRMRATFFATWSTPCTRKRGSSWAAIAYPSATQHEHRVDYVSERRQA